MPSYYETLGVSKSATTDEITTAYRNAAKRFHPDLHSNETDENIAEFANKMSNLSEAYEVLTNADSRARYDSGGFEGDQYGTASAAHVRRPNLNECMFCAHSPVTTKTLRQERGMILARRHSKFVVRACRGCGLQLAREMQNSTLLWGWVGYISFFVNIFTVVSNAGAIMAFNRLADPVPPKDQVARPVEYPYHKGESLFKRPGIYVASAILVVVFALFGGQHAQHAQQPTASSNSWGIGKCVSSSGKYITGVVSCSQPHFGKINGIVLQESFCPEATTTTFTEQTGDPTPGFVVCIDDLE